MTTLNKTVSKPKTILIFCGTIIFGFILFVIPNVFFGVTNANGGLIGLNLLWYALFQLITVCLLIYFSLRALGKTFKDIGWSWVNWPRDILLGTLVGLGWATIQFIWLIPNTGGAARADITQMLAMMDGTVIGLISYVALGVMGGGITEEVFNRGYFINVLKDVFGNPQVGLWVSAVLSILFFALGHLPTNAIEWVDIMVPTIAYTLLFVFTRRLSASIFAHGIYNMTIILLVYYMYY